MKMSSGLIMLPTQQHVLHLLLLLLLSLGRFANHEAAADSAVAGLYVGAAVADTATAAVCGASLQ
jgi:hypothetical protein